jgi:DNA-binding NarL/FixJ family response regulator
MMRGRQRVTESIGDERQRNAYELTGCELSILQLIAGGDSKEQIASELGISQAIVNSEVAGILAKMNAASTTEAAVRAIRENLVPW